MVESHDCARFLHPARTRWQRRRGHHGARTRYGAVPIDVADVVMRAWNHVLSPSRRPSPFVPLRRAATPSPSDAHFSARRSLCSQPSPVPAARWYLPLRAPSPHHCFRSRASRRYGSSSSTRRVLQCRRALGIYQSPQLLVPGLPASNRDLPPLRRRPLVVSRCWILYVSSRSDMFGVMTSCHGRRAFVWRRFFVRCSLSVI